LRVANDIPYLMLEKPDEQADIPQPDDGEQLAGQDLFDRWSLDWVVEGPETHGSLTTR
jgi:hypothetical protein